MTVHVELWHDQYDEWPDATSYKTTRKGSLVILGPLGREVFKYAKTQWDAVWRVA